MDSVCDWIAHFENWPKNAPICAHAEGRTTAAVILLASLHNRQEGWPDGYSQILDCSRLALLVF